MEPAAGGDLLTATVVLLGTGVAALVLFQRFGFGSVLGLLAAGVIIGPHGLGVLAGGEQLARISELGVAFLLFVIGLEMQPETLHAMRRQVFALGALQMVLTTALFAATATLLGLSPEAAFVLGSGFALSSTAMCVQILEERGAFYSDWGRRAFAILLFQDLAVVPLLAAIPLLAGRPELAPPPFLERLLWVAGALVFVLIAGAVLLPRALDLVARLRNYEAFTGLAILAVVIGAWVMEIAGLSMALGAFMMGLLLSRTRYHHQLEAEVAPFKGLLLGLFFIAVGMSIDITAIFRDLPRLLPFLLLLVSIKIVVVYGLLRGSGLERPAAVRAAFLLAQGGEFAFVLFGAAAARGVLSGEVSDLAVLLISASMLITPLLVRLGEALAARLEMPRPPRPVEAATASLDHHVVICGFGRVGGTVGAMLDELEIPFLAIDQDPLRVERARRSGCNAIYGNAADPQVLQLAGVGRSALVLVTLDSPATAERVVSAVHNFYPDVPIIARARDLTMRVRLMELGVAEAIPEAVELAVMLGAVVLRHLGVTEVDARDVSELIRRRISGTVAPGTRPSAALLASEEAR